MLYYSSYRSAKSSALAVIMVSPPKLSGAGAAAVLKHITSFSPHCRNQAGSKKGANHLFPHRGESKRSGEIMRNCTCFASSAQFFSAGLRRI